MDIREIQKKIEIVELTKENAGAEGTFNAIIDVLKEIAKTLETDGKAS
jgi:hypothetical protein